MKKIAKDLLGLILILPFLNGCTPLLPKEDVPPVGTYRLSTDLRYQLSRREFLLHIPPGYGADPLPLVIVLHGAFSTGRQTEAESGFSQLADAENFFVVYPEGIGLFGLLQHWNAGHCCGRAASDGVDDVDFIAKVIDTIAGRLSIDEQRIYLVGMSNGGMLAYRFAAERTDRLAAVAVVAGAMGSSSAPQPFWPQPPEPDGPLPLIIVHGAADDIIPWAGGPSRAKRGGRSFLPGAAAAEFWRRHNGCEAMPTMVEAISGSLQRLVWEGCQGGSVEVDLLEGWGHRWPGRHFISQRPKGDPLQDYDGTRRIWDFFKRH